MKFEEVGFAPAIARHLVAQLRNPLTECPPGFAEFDRACFPADFTAMLQASAGFLKDHSGAAGLHRNLSLPDQIWNCRSP